MAVRVNELRMSCIAAGLEDGLGVSVEDANELFNDLCDAKLEIKILERKVKENASAND